MIINNPDALKSWLTVIVEPLCDADPAALARYVFALLRKEKSVKELKKSMMEQLDVFLGRETMPFLERLFTAIASEEYLNFQVNSNDNNILPSINETNTMKIDKECTPPLDKLTTTSVNYNVTEMKSVSSDTRNAKEYANKIDGNHLSSVHPLESFAQQNLSPANAPRVSPPKATSDKENQPRETRRRRASLRSRSRSRSRSFERARRSRSRDRKINDREKTSRQFRNKSPPSNERRRSERRGAERSPRAFGKPRTKSHSESRSRSNSGERRKLSRSPSPIPNNVPLGGTKIRCIDFEKIGYCVRGETCPWDHGINPLVFEGINNPSVVSLASNLREYNPDAPALWNRSGTFAGPRPAFPHKGAAIPGTYPRQPGMGFRTGPSFPFPINPSTASTPLQRELISVPVVDATAGGDVSAVQTKRRYEPEDTVAVAEGPTKRKIPINSRLGPRVGLQQNCSLELRKIPRGMNTIAHLNNHFSKFGKIINIQISYDGDPEAAIVTFSTHAEANVAYRSTEAVLNNRFIKVFWHSTQNATDGSITATIAKEDPVTNGRKQSQYHLNNVIPAVPTPAAESAKSSVSSVQTPTTLSTTTSGAVAATTTTNTTSNTANLTATVQTPATLRLKNNRAMQPPINALIRKKQEDQVKAAVQLAHGLHKRKHDLLQEYVKQMKSALELVERADQSDPQRAKMLDTIKELQEKIDKLGKEISTEQVQITAQIQNQQPTKKSKEQQKKELLDIELELIAQQQEGNDTSAIQKRLEELQRSLGITNKPHFAGRNTRMRSVVSTSVDRRPTAIRITGFSKEDSDLLLGHFKHFGEITKHEIEMAVPSLTIAYATRSTAEQAVIRGRIFKEKRLQIAWAPQTPVQPPKADAAPEIVLERKSADPTPELRLEDEEEEEDAESEDRSWRR